MFEYRIIKPPDLSFFHQIYIEWIQKGFHGEMGYLERTAKRRFSLPEFTKSVLMARLFYDDIDFIESSKERIIFAKYAVRKDYHLTLKEMVSRVVNNLETRWKSLQFKIFVDSSPFPEKPMGYFSGFGFWGLSSLLIDPNYGSYFNLGGAFLSLDLGESYTPLSNDFCAKCNLCVKACPTGAIVSPHIIDARKCISYLTIEYKGIIPRELAEKIGNRVFGCDVCQNVCPFNRKKRSLEVINPAIKELISPDLEFFLKFDQEKFLQTFEETPVIRINYEKFMRNLLVIAYNSGDNSIKLKARQRILDLGYKLLLDQLKELEGI
ncbi:MAG: tRNA epoxyqueuosine(34) reductase QueG [Candidatus Hydrothermia bacterium]